MGFGPFALISLFYVVLGLRVVAQLARSWRQTFDRRFTPEDRGLVDQAAFFLLVPVSVALHELGHAVAVWAYGGRVESWGYYGFAGFVGYDPRGFTPDQQVVVAAAGTVVNLLLAAGALALVFGRRPPLRAAFNELLTQFVVVSLLNALVVYPLLDLSSGLNGDWRQMYFGGAPALSLAILVVHLGVLGALFWAWRSPAVKARLAALTGAASGARRLRLGGREGRGAPSSPPRIGSPNQGPGGPNADVPASPIDAAFEEAAARVADGWTHPVSATLQPRPGGTALALEWRDGDLRRAVVAWSPAAAGPILLSGLVAPDGFPPDRRPLATLPPPADPDRLTLALRLGMETVAGWTWTAQVHPGRRV